MPKIILICTQILKIRRNLAKKNLHNFCAAMLFHVNYCKNVHSFLHIMRIEALEIKS